MEYAIWTFVALCVVLFVSFLASLVKGQRRRNQEFKTWMKKTGERIATRRAKWQQKIAGVRHLLTGATWRDLDGKSDFVKTLFGDGMPDYLWYAVGELQMREEEMACICSHFWPEKGPAFGDIELHKSQNEGLGALLRIRSPKEFSANIIVGGHVCPLYQIGAADFFGELDEGGVNFRNLFEQQAEAA